MYSGSCALRDSETCILAGVHHVIMTAPYSERGVSFQKNILSPSIRVYFGF